MYLLFKVLLCLILQIIVIWASTDLKLTVDSSGDHRIKRSLTYPHGSIIQMSLGIIVHPDLGDPTLNINFGFQQNTPLPTNITELEYPPTVRAAKKLESVDLYRIIEYHLKSYGFHQDCLKKIICEMAFSPLHNDGILENVISHILTPTIISNNSRIDTFHTYKEAEDNGFFKKDCNELYRSCPISPLDIFTQIIDF